MSYWQRLLGIGIILAAATTAAAATEWVPTHYWESSTGGTVQTPLLSLHGQRWRVKHRHSGRGEPFQLDFFDAAGNHLETLTRLNEPLRGLRTRNNAAAGQFFLRISSPGPWSIRLEQRLSIIEQWQLQKEQTQSSPPLYKIAAWAGDTMQAEYEMQIRGNRWQALCRNNGTGTVSVSIRELETDNVVLQITLPEQGEFVGWGHRPGTYALSVNAEDSTWALEIYSEAAPQLVGGGEQ